MPPQPGTHALGAGPATLVELSSLALALRPSTTIRALLKAHWANWGVLAGCLLVLLPMCSIAD